MLEGLIQLDEKIFLFLHRIDNSFLDQFWLLITDKIAAIPIFAFLCIWIWKKANLKSAFIFGLFLVALVGFTDLTTTLVKNFFERPRPCAPNSPVYDLVNNINTGFFGQDITAKNLAKCLKYSFFSSHASVAFALAFFIAKLLKCRSKYILGIMFLWAFLVSISRIFLGFHYPADIITGGLFGILIGYLFTKVYYFVGKRHYNELIIRKP
ncbi:MAG: phosphatase PAP2 family protein [Bacteroidota bacterium]